MALASKLAKANQAYRRTFLCKLMQVTLDPSLSDDDRSALLAIINSKAFDADHVPNNRLAQALREEGFDVSSSAVDRHRRGDCSCNRISKGD